MVKKNDDRRARGLRFLCCVAAALVTTGYSTALAERKFGLILSWTAFLRESVLSWWELPIYLFLVLSHTIVLVTICEAVLYAAWSAVTRSRRAAWVPALLVCVLFNAIITMQFEVYRYFSDGIELAVARQIGGGNTRDMFRYVREELLGLMPTLIVGALVVIGVMVLLVIWSRRVSSRLENSAFFGRRISIRGFLTCNVGLIVLTSVAMSSSSIERALRYQLSSYAFAFVARVATDFDADGYGMTFAPRDPRPFDGAIHPYAVDTPGNGIDENGVGGDLPRVDWRESTIPWDFSRLKRRSILLIFLESARADLLRSRFDGQPVMPFLGGARGQEFVLVSHFGFTAPSICSALTGAIDLNDVGRPLLPLFAANGYRTAVVSAQCEAHGGTFEFTEMGAADLFADATSFPADARMNPGSFVGSLAIPAEPVVDRFLAWLDESPAEKPFFAYLNLQELHYPYRHEKSAKPLAADLIQRVDVRAANREQVWKTYLNSARLVDDALRRIAAGLEKRKLWGDSICIVVGDHGEELFDHGSLGHGFDISFEQNRPLAKILGGETRTVGATSPVAISELPTVMHNLLCRSKADEVPLRGFALCFTGSVRTPGQIGLFSSQGLVRLDLRTHVWKGQPGPGAPLVPALPDLRLVHLWESLVNCQARR